MLKLLSLQLIRKICHRIPVHLRKKYFAVHCRKSQHNALKLCRLQENTNVLLQFAVRLQIQIFHENKTQQSLFTPRLKKLKIRTWHIFIDKETINL